MFGTKQSLNAAVAFSVAVFDLVRIWKNFPLTPRHTRYARETSYAIVKKSHFSSV